jgi:hypothetical protein
MTRKIAICVPARDTMEMETAQSIVAMSTQFSVDFVATGQASLQFYWMNGTLLPDMRNDLVKAALAAGATHLLWIDSDMRFPKDALTRLLAHDAPIVGANYVQRKRPVKPTAARVAPNGERVWVYTPPAEHQKTQLEAVESLGLGLCLIEAAVFEVVPAPWFSMVWSDAKGQHMGEDVFFFRKVKSAIDVDPMIDHALSREVYHIGKHSYEWQDAYDDYPLLIEAQKPKEAAE